MPDCLIFNLVNDEIKQRRIRREGGNLGY